MVVPYHSFLVALSADQFFFEAMVSIQAEPFRKMPAFGITSLLYKQRIAILKQEAN